MLYVVRDAAGARQDNDLLAGGTGRCKALVGSVYNGSIDVNKTAMPASTPNGEAKECFAPESGSCEATSEPPPSTRVPSKLATGPTVPLRFGSILWAGEKRATMDWSS